MEAQLKRLEAAVASLESHAGVSVATSGGGGGVPASVLAFDVLIDTHISPIVEAANAIGGDALQLGELAKAGFDASRAYVLMAKSVKKPEDIMSTCKEIAGVIETAMALPDNRGDCFFHQSAFSEFIQSLQWVLVEPTPAPFIMGTLEAADFYLTKILTTFKDDPKKVHHRAFVKHIKECIKDLASYVKQYHTTGLQWNPSGVAFSEYDASTSSSRTTSGSTGGSISPDEVLSGLCERLEMLALSSTGSGDDETGTHPSVTDWDILYSDYIQPLINSARKIGGEVGDLGTYIEDAFAQTKVFILKARTMGKPSDDDLGAMAGDLIGVVGKAAEAPNNRSTFFPHQQAVAEFISSSQWVLVYPTPIPFVQSTLESADFYLNKILKNHKDDDNKQDHRDFVKYLKDTVAEIQVYLKKHHMTGLTWNMNA